MPEPNSYLLNFSSILNYSISQLHNFIFALKISDDEESPIAMGTFCHYWLARNAIASTSKRIDRRFSEPNKQNIANIVKI